MTSSKPSQWKADTDTSTRKRKSDNILPLLLLIILIVLVGRNLYLRFYRNETYEILEKKVYESKMNTKAVLVYDETVYDFGEHGTLLLDINDRRIGANVAVGKLHLESMVEIQNHKSSIPFDSNLFESLTEQILNHQPITTPIQNEEITSLEYKDFSSIIRDFHLGENLLYSNRSGWITNKLDGYEGLFHLNALDQYQYGDLISVDQTTDAIARENAFKIINNSSYYMLVQLKLADEKANLEMGSSLFVRLGEIAFPAEIKSKQTNDEGEVLVLQLKEGFLETLGHRVLDVELVFTRIDAYQIPDRAVVKDEEEVYVFALSSSGVVQKKPVNILEHENGYYLIEAKETDRSDDSYVKEYERIFLNPRSLQEGQLIQ